ncbi:MAG TPA: DUF3035 domain-containing protein [Caulobacteraceae bacterium]|jgi:hypothetical protein|nr:DUF3035 domain-containing protein [Caulobacteraceae bacterium]
MRFHRVATVALLVAGTALAGCQSTRQALGLVKVVPDEFRVVSKAPLVVPPDYSLRPPSPGEPRPQELQPESQARAALLGQRAAEQRSEGEKLLATKAGADQADPMIRYVVDDEFGAISHKDKGFADWVMFWRKGKPAAQPTAAVTADEAGATTPAPIDAAAESQRIQKLTGGKPIVIARTATKDNHIKLPGL